MDTERIDGVIIHQDRAERYGVFLKLTPAERKLLDALKGSPGVFFYHHELALAVWGDATNRASSLSNLVSRLRTKLGAEARRLMTVHPHGAAGGGYIWLDREPASKSRVWTVEMRARRGGRNDLQV